MSSDLEQQLNADPQQSNAGISGKLKSMVSGTPQKISNAYSWGISNPKYAVGIVICLILLFMYITYSINPEILSSIPIIGSLFSSSEKSEKMKDKKKKKKKSKKDDEDEEEDNDNGSTGDLDKDTDNVIKRIEEKQKDADTN